MIQNPEKPQIYAYVTPKAFWHCMEGLFCTSVYGLKRILFDGNVFTLVDVMAAIQIE